MSEHDEVEASEKRRMPDNLKPHRIRMQGGKMYLPAAFRVVWFRDELGDSWGVSTDLVEGGHGAGYATVKASIVDANGMVKATGHKTECKADFPAGWVEKAESGAIARALSFLGFGTQFDETLLEDGHRVADSPQGRAPVQRPGNPPNGHEPPRPTGGVPLNSGPGQCPGCNAPEGRRHAKACKAIAQPV